MIQNGLNCAKWIEKNNNFCQKQKVSGSSIMSVHVGNYFNMFQTSNTQQNLFLKQSLTFSAWAVLIVSQSFCDISRESKMLRSRILCLEDTVHLRPL